MIKLKYRNFCIKYKNTKKPTPEDIISWVAEAWWSNDINEEMIKLSFKKGGINLKLDGSEDSLFNWPRHPEMVLIEDIQNKSFKDSKTNEIVYDTNFISNADLDSEDDVLFDYERYSIKSIRKEVYKNLKKGQQSMQDSEENEFNNIEKDYNYYYSFGLIK